MKTPLAWRNLLHSKSRMLLAVAGIGFATMLIFMQLGFYGSILTGANLIYDELTFDLVIVSTEYDYLPRARSFDRSRLYQAKSLPDVERAVPFYVARNVWKNSEAAVRRSILVMGFRPDDQVFRVDDIRRQAAGLKRQDTAIYDSDTREIYGARVGQVAQVGQRDIRILGDYRLGTAFVELGMVVMSDLNFIRVFPGRSLDEVSIGLVNVRSGASPDAVAAQLRSKLPADVQVLTREEFAAHEQYHWVTKTSTGMIFGSGVIVAFIVGLVIVYQTLATQITKHLPEYATLKAIGYGPGYLSWIVLQQAWLMAIFGYIPGLAAAIVLYRFAKQRTFLPIDMSVSRMAIVFVLALVMSGVSGWLSMRKVTRADPADLF